MEASIAPSIATSNLCKLDHPYFLTRILTYVSHALRFYQTLLPSFRVGPYPAFLFLGRPWLRWAALAYDITLILLAIVDARRSRLPPDVRITREFGGRFAVGAETQVDVNIRNAQAHAIALIIKDEYPPQMKLLWLARSEGSRRNAHLSIPGLWAYTSAARRLSFWKNCSAVFVPTQSRLVPNLGWRADHGKGLSKHAARA